MSGRKRRNGHALSRGSTIAALDVGTAKVCCFIAKLEASGPRVIGIGHQIAQGVRAGAIVDMEAAEQAIRATVQAAEQMCGETIREVHVNVSCGVPTSSRIHVDVAIAGHEVSASDVRRAMMEGGQGDFEDNRRILHRIPIDHAIDDTTGIADPTGMFGDRLALTLHRVDAAPGPVRNLETVIERAHLDVAGLVTTPYASGLACLADDESDLGVTLVDIGAGTTSLALFFGGRLIHQDVLPVGGGHVTGDLARGLTTPLLHAERIKVLFGSLLPSRTDDHEMVEVTPVGESDSVQPNQVPRALINSIVRPRVEEILEMVRDRLHASGFDRLVGRRAVITGGASQTPGMQDYAGRVLDKQVRIARPAYISGLAEATGGPAFSTAAGLLTYALNAPDGPDYGPRPTDRTLPALGMFGRVGGWLRDHF
ncbi:MAG: cell division protein FtsA [Alphaproteobacteria bacterium]